MAQIRNGPQTEVSALVALLNRDRGAALDHRRRRRMQAGDHIVADAEVACQVEFHMVEGKQRLDHVGPVAGPQVDAPRPAVCEVAFANPE
jgi:hypothetical protein